MIDEFFAYREPAAIGVSFRRSGKVYYFAPNGLNVRQGDQVVAQTDKGLDIGEVVFIKFDMPDLEDKELKPLVRKATCEDLAHERELQLKEREARKIAEQKVLERKLPMRLIAADYTFDGQRLIFFFSAEGRVDFRDLVRDLAEVFHTRIELRQVGVRDQAKMVGGLGPCGRPLCCNAFLRNFDPVGIRVAKDQGLSLNPAKISGICDRLMCCLKYEHQTYLELAKEMPKVGQLVNTRKGPAEVRSVNLMHERLSVRYPDDKFDDLKASEVWGLDEEAPPLPEVPEEELPREDTTLPLMVRQRPKQPQRSEQAERPARSERSRAGRHAKTAEPKPSPPAPQEAAPTEAAAEGAAPSRRRRRRRSDRHRQEGGESQAPQQAQPAAQEQPSQQQRPSRPPRHAQPKPQPAREATPEGGAHAEGEQAKPAGEGSSRRRRPRFRSRRKPGGGAAGGEGGAPGTPPAGGGAD